MRRNTVAHFTDKAQKGEKAKDVCGECESRIIAHVYVGGQNQADSALYRGNNI